MRRLQIRTQHFGLICASEFNSPNGAIRGLNFPQRARAVLWHETADFISKRFYFFFRRKFQSDVVDGIPRLTGFGLIHVRVS